MTIAVDAAMLLSIANALVCSTTAVICVCRVHRMTSDSTRRIVRVAYALMFSGAFVGALLFASAVTYGVVSGGGIFGSAFRDTWVQALGWWCLVVNTGPLALLASTARTWGNGVAPHAAIEPAVHSGWPHTEPAR